MSLAPGARRSVAAARIVFLKEIRETFRDRRTIFGVVISPLLLTPALLGLVGSFIAQDVQKARTEDLVVGVVNGRQAPMLAAALRRTPNVRLEETDLRSAELKVRERRLRLVVVLPENADAASAAGRAVHIRLLLDAGNDKSAMAAARMRGSLGGIASAMVAQRLRKASLPVDYAVPFKITDEPIKSGGAIGTRIIAAMLPYMLALACFSSGIYAANDSVAGEKERGTLETLLSSPATRREIVMGKFMSVALVCLIGSILSVTGLIIPFTSGMRAYAWIARGGMSLQPAGLAVMLLMQIPLAILFAGLLLTVSTIARNQKEAQTYLGPMMIGILVPSMMSMFMGPESPKTMALVPILNASLIIKQALMNSYDALFIAIALVASAGYAALAVAVSTRMFQRESVLLKS